MNLLTHAKVALDVVDDHKLHSDERDLLVVGSILPDVAEFGIANEPRTHKEGLQFLRYLGKQYRMLGVGALLHGEQPHGLDYYAHHGFYEVGNRYAPLPPRITRDSGYIARKYPEIASIARDHQRSIGPIRPEVAVHFVTEFCFDHIVAEREAEIPRLVFRALKNNMVMPGVLNFANYFQIDRKHLRRLKSIMRSRHVKTYLSNFSTVEGTAHNFQNFVFLKSLRDKNNGHRHGFLRHLGHVARSSLGFLQTKLRDRSLVQMFERCTEVVRKDSQQFLDSTEKKLKKMVAAERLMK